MLVATNCGSEFCFYIWSGHCLFEYLFSQEKPVVSHFILDTVAVPGPSPLGVHAPNAGWEALAPGRGRAALDQQVREDF